MPYDTAGIFLAWNALFYLLTELPHFNFGAPILRTTNPVGNFSLAQVGAIFLIGPHPDPVSCIKYDGARINLSRSGPLWALRSLSSGCVRHVGIIGFFTA